MLPQKNRLNIRIYFNEIRGNGKKIHTQLFSLYYRILPDQSPSKLNVVISKKIAKEAVKRNRMRRLLHAALTEIIPGYSHGVEGVFFVHQDYSHEKSQVIKEQVQSMLKKINTMQN